MFSYISTFCLAILFLGCNDDGEGSVPDLVKPTNLVLSYNQIDDGFFDVINFSFDSENTLTYQLDFGTTVLVGGQSVSKTTVNGQTNSIQAKYATTGTYVATLFAYGTGGLVESTSVTIETETDFRPSDAIINSLTGGSEKKWLWDAGATGHLGVGPPNEFEPIWYQATPFEKEGDGCVYNDEITFAFDPSTLKTTFSLNNGGVSFFNRGEVNSALGEAEPDNDRCYDFSPPTDQIVTFTPSTSGAPATSGTVMELGSEGFMGYFLGTTSYELLSINDDAMYVRCMQTDDAGNQFAWYQRFIPEGGGGIDTGLEYELFWSDEFETAGAPSAANWTYDLGAGGWGNQEIQHYTNRPDNVTVEDGSLKITAKRENFNGSPFTSARIRSQGLKEFQYGKIDISAKLPEGGGTWPALWMLGSNFNTVGWPTCGEIDIMEHVGNNAGRVLGTFHTANNNGGNSIGSDIVIENPFTEFHTYTVEWTPDVLILSVDGVQYHNYSVANKTQENWPFDQDFFLVLNIAVGGTLGGVIDAGFNEGVMEIDYVRVYQAN